MEYDWYRNPRRHGADHDYENPNVYALNNAAGDKVHYYVLFTSYSVSTLQMYRWMTVRRLRRMTYRGCLYTGKG